MFGKLAQDDAYGKNPSFLPYQMKLMITFKDNSLNPDSDIMRLRSLFQMHAIAHTSARYFNSKAVLNVEKAIRKIFKSIQMH